MTARASVSPVSEAGRMYVNHGQEEQMEIWGFKKSSLKTISVYIGYFLTVGLLRLVFHWRPDLMLKATHTACDMSEATSVLLRDQYMQWFVDKVKATDQEGKRLDNKEDHRVYFDGKLDLTSFDNQKDGVLKYFRNKKIIYVWHQSSNDYQRLRGLEEELSCSYFHSTVPLSKKEQDRRKVIYGDNTIVVKVVPIIILIFTQMLNPFYVFQVFSCSLWFADEYYYYAGAIVIMSVLSLSIEIYMTRSMQQKLKKTISGVENVVRISERNGVMLRQEVLSDALVPGDVLEIPQTGCNMQCDAVLVSGDVIVNESMLTGESVPVTKTPVPNPRSVSEDHEIIFSLKEHARHVLYCGTNALQSRQYKDEPVRAIVIRTGFSTAKGELVRSIMFPKPLDFKFSQDAYKFIGCLALISLIGMIYTLVIMVQRGNEAGDIIKRTLDLVTIVIPPALPAAMTIGVIISQRRLKLDRIFCISPRNINTSGAIDVFCFDKTGTITGDGLEMRGVVPSEDAWFRSGMVGIETVDRTGKLVSAMASCHSLTHINGQLQGDPLDLKIFQSVRWDLDEPTQSIGFDVHMPTVVRSEIQQGDNLRIGIARQFPFSSRLQRMSVIAQSSGSQTYDLFMKGSPEMIASLSKPDTVPTDFVKVLDSYTQQGFRVIAIGWKQIDIQGDQIPSMQREQLENDVNFLGLLVLENRLKPQSTAAIEELREANIRTVMVTGDNMLTALSVAKECKMVEPGEHIVMVDITKEENSPAEMTFKRVGETKKPELDSYNGVQVNFVSNENLVFAMSGASWALARKCVPEIIPKIIIKGAVFARFSPEQKQQLVEELQDVGYYVGMCGDGSNDCGALKTAHSGISLSDAEASVASPFTYKDQHIGCVPITIKEGRAALSTSYGMFKYMATYSLTQFTSVCLLYWIDANLTDFGFLYIDLFLLTTLCITYAFTRRYSVLAKKPPHVSLLNIRPISSILFQTIVHLAFQVGIWIHTRNQPWHVEYDPEGDDNSDEVTTVFLLSNFQYITMSICYSKGPPYRQPLYTNFLLMGNILAVLILSLYVTISPHPPMEDFLELLMPEPMSFRGLILGLAAVNFIICFGAEYIMNDNEKVRDRCEQNRCYRKPRQHEIILEEINSSGDWPPVSKQGNSPNNGNVNPAFDPDSADASFLSNKDASDLGDTRF